MTTQLHMIPKFISRTLHIIEIVSFAASLKAGMQRGETYDHIHAVPSYQVISGWPLSASIYRIRTILANITLNSSQLAFDSMDIRVKPRGSTYKEPPKKTAPRASFCVMRSFR